MLIISNKKDYYDSMAYAYGIDKSIVFKREILELDSKFLLPQEWSQYAYKFPMNQTEKDLLNVIRYFDRQGNGIERYMLLFFCDKIYIVSQSNNEFTYGISNVKSSYTKHQLENLQSNFSSLNVIRHNVQLPYFLFYRCHGQYICEMPLLRDIGFDSIMSADECYQNIEMYLAKKEPNIIEISDKDKINQHGFDKFSFRKQ